MDHAADAEESSQAGNREGDADEESVMKAAKQESKSLAAADARFKGTHQRRKGLG